MGKGQTSRMNTMGGNFMSSMPLIGGIFDDSTDKAMGELKDARKTYEAIGLPDGKWEYFKPENLGSEDATYSLIKEDPETRLQQLSVLEKLAGLSEQGMSPEDEYAYFKAQQMGNQMARSGNQAAMQNAAARGISGSGLEFAMRDSANQEAAQRTQEAAMSQAADAARQRALYLQAYGDSLGNLRNQDLGTQKANTDIINQFNMANTQNRNQANQENVRARNDAQMFNQQGKRDLAQQNFDNQITKAGGIAQARSQMANAYAAQNAARTSERNNKTQMGMQGLMSMFSDARVKENVKPFDVDAFLNSLTGYTWNYTDPKFGTGQFAGVMAQDLEETVEGRAAVYEQDGVKVVNYARLVPVMLACMAEMQKEIKKLKGGV